MTSSVRLRVAFAWVLCWFHSAALSASFISAQAQASAQPGPDRAWYADSQPDGVSAPRYAGAARTSRFISMRDGVRLAVDIYLPVGLEPTTRLPTILEQTRYHRSLEPRPEFQEALGKPPKKFVEFVTRGYAYVVVDVRGTGASFGSRRMELMPDEVRDGKDVVDWIIAQPWSDGKVGATGVSYVGTTAELLLVNTHPAVKAVAPQFALFDSYSDIVSPGGVKMTWFTKVWGQVVGNMDKNMFSEQARERILGIRPVDEDVDRKLLGEAISAHAPNVDVHKEISAITFRDDRGPSGWTFAEISPHAYSPKLKAPVRRSTAIAAGTTGRTHARRLLDFSRCATRAVAWSLVRGRTAGLSILGPR